MVREGEEGFIVPIRDVTALKEKIHWCYEHRDETREMGRAACERASSGFTWDDYGTRVAAFYDEIIGNRSRQDGPKEPDAALVASSHE